jgi:ribosomal protein L40E
MTIHTRPATPEYRARLDAHDWQKAEPTANAGLRWTCRRCGASVPDRAKACPCGSTRLALGPVRPAEITMIDPPPIVVTGKGRR